MDIDEYQKSTEETAVYPQELPDCVGTELLYVTLGLSGEVGEVSEKVKKAVREDDLAYLDDLEKELGDVFWYLVRVCEELYLDASDVCEKNRDKLLDRRERDVLTGEGDDR